MDERNKDLPLIVSEILIEMHEMKDALNRIATVVLKQPEHTNSMFNVLLDESKENIEFLTNMVTKSRQETISLTEKVRQEAQEDRRFMTYSLNKAMGQQQQTNAAFEQHLTKLEAKYNG